MKYISLLMLLICMSAFANAGNSVPVEKEKAAKSTKNSTRGETPGSGNVSFMASRPFVHIARKAAAPISAVADVFNFTEGTPTLTDNVLANDTHNGYPVSRAVLNAGPSEPGTFTLGLDGTFIYLPPNPQFSGTVTFSYHIEDDVQPNSAVVTVTLNINGPNDPPVITAPASFTTAENTQGTITGVSVADPDALSYNAVFVTFTPSDPSVTFSYTPTGTISINMDPDGITIALGGNINNINAYLAGGNLKYNPPANSTTSFNFTIRATDFTSTPSQVVPVNILDVTPPAAPVTLTPANGSTTGNNTPSYSGTAEPNSTVTVYVDGVSIGTTPANAGGNWSLTQPTPLADGPHTVYSTATDAANNTSTNSNTNTFTVDTTPPPAPTTMLPANGSTINNQRPLIYGTTSAGSTVTLVLDGLSYGPLSPGGSGDWSYTPAADLGEGNHTAYATASDAVGNTSPAGNTNTFTIDITPPPAPVAITPANGSRISDNTPGYSGTAEPGSTVTVIVDGTPVGTTTTDGSGNWTFTQPTPLADGSHTVRATATDAAGNTSVSSNTNTFIVDTTPPAAPVTLTPVNGSITGDNTPGYTGTAEPGSTVTVIVDGTSVGTTTADGSGNWSFTQPVALADGSHTVLATATDAAGNTSVAGNTNTFTVDTTPPAAPVVIAQVNGSFTNDNTPGYSGTAEPGSTVTVIVDGLSLGTTTANGSGNWSFTQPVALADGSHTVLATSTDAAGNTSVSSNTNTFTVDTTPPAAPVVITPVNGSITGNNTPTHTGTAEPGSTVNVIVDGLSLGTTTADFSGNWTFTQATPLAGGSHTVRATATDAAGNTSVSSNTNTFTVDIIQPAVTITSSAPALVNIPFTATIEFTEDVTGFVAGDITATNATLSAFTAVDGNTYTVLVTPTAAGAVTLDVAAAVAQDAAGNDNTAATQFIRTYDASQPGVTITSAAPAIVNAPFTTTIEFTEDVTGFVAGDITATNATLSAFTAVDGNTYTVLVTPTANGAVTLDVAAAVAQDAAGNDNTAATQFTRTYDASQPGVSISSAAPAIVNAPFTATIEFTEDVTGFVAGDITATNATLSAFTAVDGNTYTVLVTPTANGAVTLDVAAAVAQDAAGNDNTAATQFTRTYDATQPGVSITSAAPAIVNAPFTATIEFTEDVTGFVVGDITAGNATLSAFTAVDGNTYTVLVTPTANGAVTLDVAAAVAQDAAGNDNTAATQFTKTYDASQPGVSITSAAPAIVNVPFTATIEFTEDVTGFVVGDITATNATLSAFTAVDGNTYTVLVTPTANGAVTLDVAAAVAQDAAGNDNTAAAQFSRTYDASKPGVTITSTAPAIVNAPFTATIEFTEDVTGFVVGDITATNATLSAFTAVDGNTYTVLVTPTANGAVTLDVAAAVAQDAAGNNNTAATQFTRTYDASQPGVSITSAAPAIVNAPFTATIEFTEDVTGFVVGDITATNATLSAFTAVDGNTYTVLVTPTANGAVTLDVAAAVAQDAAGNDNTAATQFTKTYDASQPGVSISSAAPAIVNAPFTATIEFTEDVTGFVAGDITATNATLSAFTAVDGNTYTVLVTPTANGAVTLDVAAAVAQDAAGNDNTAATQFTRTYDASQPGVSISSAAPAIVNAPFTATIEFTEDVTGFVAGDITATNATLSAFTAVDGNTYTVLVTPGSDGPVTLDVPAAIAKDAAGNDNTAAAQFTRTYDATAPTVIVTIAAPVPPAPYIATFTFS